MLCHALRPSARWLYLPLRLLPTANFPTCSRKAQPACLLPPVQAGYGISIAVLCILSGCYFKNARQEMKPPRAFPVWSIGVRLLIAPVRGLLLQVHDRTVSTVAVPLPPCV